MFRIEFEADDIIRVTRSGLWNADVAFRYATAITDAVRTYLERGVRPGILIDMREASTLTQEALGEMERAFAKIGDGGVRKIAVCSSSAVTRMQSKRVLSPLVLFAAFEKPEDALEWLRADGRYAQTQ